MCGPGWDILLMFGSHNMRHVGFRRLTVVNGTPRIGASHNLCGQFFCVLLLEIK